MKVGNFYDFLIKNTEENENTSDPNFSRLKNKGEFSDLQQSVLM